MAKKAKDRANPQAAVPIQPTVLPDVVTQPHPSTSPSGAGSALNPAAGQGVLEEALPEITAAARKVGGFKKLAEIATQLDRDGEGQ